MVFDFDFLRVDGGYSLDTYTGNDSSITIPDAYLNKPVIKIERDFASPRKLDTSNFDVELFSDMFYNIPITNKSITEVFVPDTIQTISKEAFSSCPNLTKISASSPIDDIHKQAFSYCYRLTDVSFYFWKIFSVDEQAGFAIFKLENWDDVSCEEQALILAFIKRRKALVEAIFTSNSSVSISILIQENIKLSLEQIDLYLQHSINSKSTAITAIFLEYKNLKFTRKQIDEFEESKEMLAFGLVFPTLKQLRKAWDISLVGDDIFITGYKGKNFSEVVPEFTFEGHRIVGFKNSSKSFYPIQKLTILAKIERLEDSVFQFFTSLQYISLPSSVNFIGESAFSSCHNLKEIFIPEDVAFIGKRTFFNCYSLEKVYLPSSVNIVQAEAFANCTSLSLVEFTCEVELENKAFFNCPKLKIIRNY